MRLITTNDLTPSFRDHLKSAEQVDIAVAWASMQAPIDDLLKFSKSGKTVRALVGTYGGATSVQALRDLRKHANLKLAPSKGNSIFHPKFYLFHLPNKKRICWVGSANFSLGGFERNEELVHEFEDTGYAQKWFDAQWNGLKTASKADIDEYEENKPNWVRTTYQPKKSKSKKSVTKHPVSLVDRSAGLDWNGYVDALNACDAYWKVQGYHFSVLDDEWSYVDTIKSAAPLFRRRNWDNLTSDDVQILLGHKEDTKGAYGLLGSMKSARTVKNVFLEPTAKNLKVRRSILDTLKTVLRAPGSAFPDVAVSAMASIKRHPGFGVGVATRLLALARPDKAVSVNQGSCLGLHRLWELPKTPSSLGTQKNYRRLLVHVYNQPWYHTPQPEDFLEQTIWSMRAALIDSFVYGYDD